MPHTGRAVIAITSGRKFALISPGVDAWVSISASAAGDSSIGDFHFAKLTANLVYVFSIPTPGGPWFLSGTTTDPNGDTVPTPLTFIDSGAGTI